MAGKIFISYRREDTRADARFEPKRRADEAIAKRKAIEDETLRKAQDAAHGRPMEFLVFGWVEMGSDCRSLCIPLWEVSRLPKFGTIRFRDEDVTINTLINNERQYCIGQTIRGRAAYYMINEKDRDNTVTDQMSFRIQYASGHTCLDEFAVNLVPRHVTRTNVVRK